jgi:nitrogenase molybdenum-iron protein NifN
VVESVIEQWVPEKPQHGLRNRRVNLLLSHLLTPGDELLRSYVEAFGLQPVIAGSFAVAGWSPGKRRFFAGHPGRNAPARIEQMGQSLCTFAIGVSLSRAASLLAQRSRGEVIVLPI